MRQDKVLKEALILLNELTHTQTYLLSGVCPEQVKPILMATQTILLSDLHDYLTESLGRLDRAKQNSEDLNPKEKILSDLNNTILSVNKSIEQFSHLLKCENTDELDKVLLISELDSLQFVREELEDMKLTA